MRVIFAIYSVFFISIIEASDFPGSEGKTAIETQATRDEVVLSLLELELQFAEETHETRVAAEKARLNYFYDSALKERSSVLWWNKFVTNFSFLLVIVILLFGIAISFYQLRTPAEKVQKSTLKIKIIGLEAELNTHIVGLIVMFLSLLFFYVFSIEMYDVVELSNQTIPTSPQAPVVTKAQ